MVLAFLNLSKTGSEEILGGENQEVREERQRLKEAERELKEKEQQILLDQ